MPAAQISWQIVRRSYESLATLARPAARNSAEYVPWCFFDSVSSGTTVLAAYNFFATQQTDRTLGNLSTPGTLADGQYFEPHYLGFEALQPVTAASEVNVNNLITLYYVSRPVLNITYAQKQYGNFPLTHINRPGGLSVTSSITTHSEAMWNSDGVGVWLNGAMLFEPRQTFTFELAAVAGGTITTAALLMRLSMYGTLYRRLV